MYPLYYFLPYLISLIIYFIIKYRVINAKMAAFTIENPEKGSTSIIKFYDWFFKSNTPIIINIHKIYLSELESSKSKFILYNEYLLVLGLIGTIINISVMIFWQKYYHIFSLLPLGFYLLFSIFLYRRYKEINNTNFKLLPSNINKVIKLSPFVMALSFTGIYIEIIISLFRDSSS